MMIAFFYVTNEYDDLFLRLKENCFLLLFSQFSFVADNIE